MKKWILAFRLRTLPLALASVAMGGFLAIHAGGFRTNVFWLCCLVTIVLQILSNLANDYGDSVHGADHAGRQGPSRSVQTGAISSRAMLRAVVLFSVFSLFSGLLLLWVALGGAWLQTAVWLVIGLAAIAAAITYTAGSKPYGYMGLGDLSVIVFFGPVAVLGTVYMITGSLYWSGLLPAIASGLLAAAVLNLNNIRDIDSDREAGKFSIPVRFGRKVAVGYHRFLLFSATGLCIVYSILRAEVNVYDFLFVLVLPFFMAIIKAVATLGPVELDGWLKRMALSALLFTLLFGIGSIMG